MGVCAGRSASEKACHDGNDEQRHAAELGFTGTVMMAQGLNDPQFGDFMRIDALPGHPGAGFCLSAISGCE